MKTGSRRRADGEALADTMTRHRFQGRSQIPRALPLPMAGRQGDFAGMRNEPGHGLFCLVRGERWRWRRPLSSRRRAALTEGRGPAARPGIAADTAVPSPIRAVAKWKAARRQRIGLQRVSNSERSWPGDDLRPARRRSAGPRCRSASGRASSWAGRVGSRRGGSSSWPARCGPPAPLGERVRRGGVFGRCWADGRAVRAPPPQARPGRTRSVPRQWRLTAALRSRRSLRQRGSMRFSGPRP